MTTNDQLILSEFLQQRKAEIAQEMDESKFFEIFVSEQILKDLDLSWDELEEGIVGAGGDGGIDSIYFFINGVLIHEDTDFSNLKGDINIVLYIIQAKRSAGFSEDALHRLRSSMSDLLNLSNDIKSFYGVYNQELIQIMERLRVAYRRFASRLPKISIQLYYATQGIEIHPNVERLVNPLRDCVLELFSNAEVSFEFTGARNLLELARKKPKEAYELHFTDAIPGRKSYVCLVNIMNYYRFITDKNGIPIMNLFDANVRDYQHDVQVNLGIRESLSNPQGEDFWWLNNGVTIICSKAVSSGKVLNIENPQVVNGLQTSMEIIGHFKSSKIQSSEERCLLVRVIEPETEASYERIIVATNSQTGIPLASLKANDQIHRDIEDFLKSRDWYYERRKNHYKNEQKPLEKIISISYMAQAVMAILLGRPNDARARPSTLLKKQEDYQKVFNDKYPLNLYLVSAIILKSCENYLREKELLAKDIINLKYHLAFYVIRLYTKTASLSPEQVTSVQLDRLDNILLEKSLKEIQFIYHELGGNDQVSKSHEFVEVLFTQLGEGNK
ncbi:MAG TPA: hypothetical protein DDW50_13025 [Firmicutes bacterium]|nr:hypothetical protein [Bacillota bacterium]